MTRVLAASVAALIATWQLADALTPSAMLLAAAFVVVGLVVFTARHARSLASGEAPAGMAALRRRSARPAFLRLADPDAAGRPRPRAPTNGPWAG